MSCVISYLLISFVEFIKQVCGFDNVIILNNVLCISFISMILGIILSILLATAIKSNWLKVIMSKAFNRTQYDNIWEDVIDFKNGSNLTVYLKDKDYYFIGHCKYIEENKENPFIAISETHIMDMETDEEIDKLNSEEYTVIKLSDIDYFEVK